MEDLGKNMSQSASILWQVFATNEEIIDVFSQVANEDGMPPEAVIRGNLDDAYRSIVKLAPKVLFLQERIDLPASSYLTLGDFCDKNNIGFVLVGLEERFIRFDPDNRMSGLNFKQMAAYHVDEYLNLPLTSEKIRLCVGEVISEYNSQISKPSFQTKTILFAGVQAGVGASSLCANYATVLANETNKPCLILDFDWSCGNLWISFGIDPVKTFTELLEDPSRIDGALIESSVKRLGDNLFLLSDYTEKMTRKINTNALDSLLKGIDGRYGYVIVDCPVYQREIVFPMLSYANDVFLATDLTQPSLSMLKRLLSNSNFEHMYGNLHLAMNNREPEDTYTLEDEDFTMCYDFKKTILLPYCKGVMQEALLDGQVLADYDEDHKYIKSIKKFIKQNEISVSSSWWKKLIRKEVLDG